MAHSDGWMVLLHENDGSDIDDFGGDRHPKTCSVKSCGQGDNNNRPSPKGPLARVDEMVTFKPTASDEYCCQLHIQNVAPNSCSIIFKIKTTSPDKYRVIPTIAVVEAGGMAVISITSQGGLSADHILQDRFQVQACVLPQGALDDDTCSSIGSSTAQSRQIADFVHLNNTFKRLVCSCGAAAETYKVSVHVDPRSPACGPSGTFNEQMLKKSLEELETRMQLAESMHKKQQDTLNRVYLVASFTLICIIGMCVAGIYTIWFTGNGCVSEFCQKMCPGYVRQSGGCGGGDGDSCGKTSFWPFSNTA